MGEVLSQSQIDALLGRMNDETEKESIMTESTKKERKYDFSTPKVFTKERLKLIDSIYNNYARVVSSHLTSILRLPCEIELMDIEEQKYYEFSNALTENDILTVIDANIPDVSYDKEPAMLQISNPVICAMIDRLMGGAGDPGDDVNNGFTAIELTTFEKLVLHTIPIMTDVWQSYVNVTFDFSKIEINPRLMQAIGPDDVVLIIVLNINIEDVSGQVSICFPGSTLETMCKIFEENNLAASKRKDNQSEETSENILTNISGSMLDVKAKLCEVELTLEDIYNMQVGDIINLNKPKQSDTLLYIEDMLWFTGEMGVQNKNLAIRINGSAEDL